MATILVVDDERLICDLLQIVLNSHGHEVVIASNGRDALKLFVERRPRLILVDICMPDMNGVTVLRELRAREYHGGVIVLSGSREERLLKDMLSMGAVELMSKPFDLERLALAIQVGLILTNLQESALKSA